MKRILFISTIIAFAFAGCQKAELTPICENNNTGVLLMDSHQPQPFHIFLDGAFLGRVEAHSEKRFTVSPGTYAVTAQYASGSGNVWSLSVTITQCQTFRAGLY
jgi:hypothetical protein